MPPRARKTATRRTAPTKPSESLGDPSPEQIKAAQAKLEEPAEKLDATETYVDDDDNDIDDTLVFSTDDYATDDVEDDPNDTKFITVDGQELMATKPDPGAWVVLISSLAGSATVVDRTQAIMSIVDDAFDEESRLYIHTRLRARKDKFNINILADIVNGLIAAWTPEQLNRAERRRRQREGAKR